MHRRGADRIRTGDGGFAIHCLSHLATAPCWVGILKNRSLWVKGNRSFRASTLFWEFAAIKLAYRADRAGSSGPSGNAHFAHIGRLAQIPDDWREPLLDFDFQHGEDGRGPCVKFAHGRI